MILPNWVAGAPDVTVPTVPAEPAVAAADPGVVASLGSLVSGQDAFRANLAAFLRSERGKHTKLAEGMNSTPPRVQTSGLRKGAIVLPVTLGGRMYHIYFHKNGQREVIALPGKSGHPYVNPGTVPPVAGGTLAPS